MSLLEIENVTRRFGGLVAVDDVTTRVEAGELVGLIGPNGAGKTTLFNLISGFTALTSGAVRFKGAAIDGSKPHVIAARGMSRTFQNLRVFPNMSVFDNVSVGSVGAMGQSAFAAVFGRRGRSDAISARTWEALERVGLAEQSEELAANLSYGKRKYLEIARALAMRPDLLILDEPAAGLNDSETAELARFIRTLNDDGLAVMLVEHDMNLVMGICSRVVVLASGRKIADAEPAVVRADPAVLEAYLGVDE
ncbi:ABC transporter ATP-binding protein [Pinisolibacter aquiterrae]|uniref:ABC transporter ATP-binding protein n=1 Tax=Pinisolibacter aquiterrae TaxID=2815579 RepID=UPI001C3CCECD|nr:ABC transporter ATP-binding protein [Pinisolibacter aquiterrae]MBV5265798.1 ABC transporter ATP-binding protein [Pinisolibacter aquiterrae]MCC8236637.1 ABC transporter ATP-binding protein [Pinisolibacter aquiterrae]